MHRKKVIIMTVGLGGGHNAMARNISHVFASMSENVEVKIIDVIADAWPRFNDAICGAYAGSTTSSSSWLFRIYYVLSDKFPQPIQWFANIAFRRYARQKFAAERPDMIIATYPFLSEVAARARNYHHATTPIIQTITDARHVQGIWLTQYADMILTATKDTVPYLVSRGIQPDKVRHIGFPAAEIFYTPTNMTVVRKRLGLDRGVPTIMLTAGGAGLNQQKVLEVAKNIGTLRVPYQIILNAGKNDDLLRRFETLAFPYATKVVVEGFTDNMPDYLRASDIICSKAGWLTINEALVMQRPLIIYDAIPGHEEQNVKHVEEHRYGIFEPDPHKIAGRIATLLASPGDFHAYKLRMEQDKTNANPYAELSALFTDYLVKS